jgi:hypothetical protein
MTTTKKTIYDCNDESIEVTREMEQAGHDHLTLYDRHEDSPANYSVQIYRVMEAARHRGPTPKPCLTGETE